MHIVQLVKIIQAESEDICHRMHVFFSLWILSIEIEVEDSIFQCIGIIEHFLKPLLPKRQKFILF